MEAAAGFPPFLKLLADEQRWKLLGALAYSDLRVRSWSGSCSSRRTSSRTISGSYGNMPCAFQRRADDLLTRIRYLLSVLQRRRG